MIRRPPRSTRTDTLFPYTTLFRSNIRVIDLSKVLAGPLCGQFLGELGADVIKVEPIGKGDDTRAWLPQSQGESAVFMAMNHNKRSIALDLTTEAGRHIAYDLVRGADHVLQGFGGGPAATHGGERKRGG